MSELKLPYKVRKYIDENKQEIDNCIMNAVGSSKKTEIYITDLDVILDYMLYYNIFSQEFYQSIINYCKDLLEKKGYYVKLYTENPDELDWIREINEYKDTKFKPIMTVYTDEKDYKRANILSEGATLLGGLIGLLTS